MAKGIANGFPLSAIVSRKELMDKQPVRNLQSCAATHGANLSEMFPQPGSQGGTYGGNPVACAAGVAVQKAFREEGILANVEARSKELFKTLRDLQADPTVGDSIAEVRGLGLMVGIEFKIPGDPYTPAQGKVPAKMASRVQNKCLEKDLLTLTTSIYETIRCVSACPCCYY